MKYTIEQKRILSLCRKYKGVRVHFKDLFCTINIADESTTFLTEKFYKEESDIEMWMKTWTIPKQVGRPKGSVKPNRKVKRVLSLTKEADEQLTELARQRNESRSAVVNSAIGCLHNTEIME